MLEKVPESNLQNVKVSDTAMDKRKDTRFFKKLMVKIVSQGKNSWGAVQDISQNGLFIRTNKAFHEGLKIDIELIMPNSDISFLKGIVRRSTTTEESIRKIIDLNARASARVIERFNKKAEEVNKSGKIPFSLVVPVPDMPEANIESPQTQEEYDSLPSGATYISPADGKKYRKP